MPLLREVQTTFVDAMLGRDSAPAAEYIAVDGLLPEARLQIYRHHLVSSLTAALQATYPVVARLVGDGFFRYAAHEFIGARPPAGPCLFEYGEALGDFLAAFPPCRELSYLSDVARLEWLLNVATHADEFVPLDPANLRYLGPDDAEALTFRFDPSVSFVASSWPIDTIWHANQPDADSDRTIDLDAGGVRLEIRRVGDDVVFRGLEPAAYAFRRSLLAGCSLAGALTTAQAEDEAFDVTEALRALFEDNVLSGFRLAHDRKGNSS